MLPGASIDAFWIAAIPASAARSCAMKMPPGFQSLRDLQPWRHTLAFSEWRLRVDAFLGMQVCAAERRASQRSGDDRSRRPFEYNGPAKQVGMRQKNRGPTWGATVKTVQDLEWPNQIVNRRVRDGPMQGAGRERLRRTAGTVWQSARWVSWCLRRRLRNAHYWNSAQLGSVRLGLSR